MSPAVLLASFAAPDDCFAFEPGNTVCKRFMHTESPPGGVNPAVDEDVYRQIAGKITKTVKGNDVAANGSSGENGYGQELWRAGPVNWAEGKQETGDEHVALGSVSSDGADEDLLVQMAAAVTDILQALGEDVSRDGLLETPLRVAKAFQYATTGYRQAAVDIIALFPEEPAEGGDEGWGGGSGGMVAVRDIELFSCCRDCLLPFRLRCHVAYIPSAGRVMGLSKLSRVAEAYARRLQAPGELARQLAQALAEAFEPLGVAVVLECWHLSGLHMGGAKVVPAPGITGGIGTAASSPSPSFLQGRDCDAVVGWSPVPVRVCAATGEFERGDRALWEEFLAMLPLFEEFPDSDAPNNDDNHRVGSGGEGAGCSRRDGTQRAWHSDDCEEGRRRCRTHFCPFVEAECHLDAGADAVGAEGAPEVTRCDGCAAEEGERVACNEDGSSYRAHAAAAGSGLSWCGAGLDQVRDEASRSLLLAATERLALAVGARGHDHDELRQTARHYAQYLTQATRGGLLSLADIHPDSQVGAGESGSGESVPTTNGAGGSLSFNGNGGRIAAAVCSAGECSLRLLTHCGIPSATLCEHHLLPFFGSVHVGYVVGEASRAVDRAVVASVVQMYSLRPQVQERLTRQIGEGVMRAAKCKGVMVVMEASHMCMASRGTEKAASRTSTIATLGCFTKDFRLRAQFMRQLPREVRKSTCP
eukprot:jgi/Mesen1/7636/ME000004S07904